MTVEQKTSTFRSLLITEIDANERGSNLYRVTLPDSEGGACVRAKDMADARKFVAVDYNSLYLRAIKAK